MSSGNGWMPLYIGDYLSDTMELDAAQHGAYLLLLMYYWRNGPLPNDDAKLAQIARTELRIWKRTVGPVVKAFFRVVDGRLHQKRADIEIAKASECQQRAAEKRQTDNDRLRSWRSRQGQNGSHPPTNVAAQGPPETDDETRFKGVSERVSQPVSQRSGNAVETRKTLDTDTDLYSTETKDIINQNNPLSPSCTVGSGSRAREADGLAEVLANAGVASPEPGSALKPEEKPVGAEVVQMHVRRVAKAVEMRIPYGEVRSVDAQLEALKQQPRAVGADVSEGQRWAPAEPVRTREQMIAALGVTPEAMAAMRAKVAQRFAGRSCEPAA